MSQKQEPEWLQKNSCIFYKLIMDSIIQDKKLELPSKFARKYGDELSSIVTLTSSEGRVWVVEVEKLNQKNIWFCNGWQEFMKHYSIQSGYFLVFKYEGKSNFNVRIFNLPACEVKSPRNALSDSQSLNPSNNADEPKIHNEKKVVCSCPGCPASGLYGKEDQHYKSSTGEEGSDLVYSERTESECDGDAGVQFCSTELFAQPVESRQRRTKRIRHVNELGIKDELELFDVPLEREKDHYTNCVPKQARIATSEQKALTFKVASMFRPENPSCTIILRPSYVYKGLLLHLPRWFARTYLDGVAGFIPLLCREKQWLVRCVCMNGNAKLSSGWPEFVWENNLSDGDVCVFEVINSGNTMLKVTLFRVLEVAGTVD